MPAGVVNGVVGVVGPRQQELGDWHKGVALLEQGLQNGGQGLRGVEGRVVEEDDRPRLHPAHHPLGDLFGGEVLPVQAVTVPNRFKYIELL